MEKKNTTLGLWCFIFVVAIGLLYLNNYIWQGKVHDLMFHGGYVISFFMFLFGYSIVKHYKDNKKEKGNKVFKFTIEILKKYYPIYLLGVVLAFVVINVINKTGIGNTFNLFFDSIWEFLGLSGVGAVSVHELAVPRFDAVLGYNYLWNSPLSIFSNLLIGGYILYYIFDKNEELFKGIVGPLIVIVGLGTLGLGSVNKLGLSNIIPSALLKSMIGVTLGMESYYLIEYFKGKKFSEVMRLIFSVVHIGLAIFFLYNIFAGINFSEVTNGLFLYIFFIVLMINNDYVSDLYNNSSLCMLLGKLSIYYYAIFVVVIFMINR